MKLVSKLLVILVEPELATILPSTSGFGFLRSGLIVKISRMTPDTIDLTAGKDLLRTILGNEPIEKAFWGNVLKLEASAPPRITLNGEAEQQDLPNRSAFPNAKDHLDHVNTVLDQFESLRVGVPNFLDRFLDRIGPFDRTINGFLFRCTQGPRPILD